MSQKGTVPGKKGSAHPNRAGMGQKRDSSRQEGVGESKNRAGRGRHVRKGTVPGKKGSARPKTGQEEVRASKKGQFRARRGRRVPKRGRKGFVRPEKGRLGREGVGAGINGAGRGRKGSVRPERGRFVVGRVVWIRKWEGGGRLVSKCVRKGREGDVWGQHSGRGLGSSLSSFRGACFPAGGLKNG